MLRGLGRLQSPWGLWAPPAQSLCLHRSIWRGPSGSLSHGRLVVAGTGGLPFPCSALEVQRPVVLITPASPTRALLRGGTLPLWSSRATGAGWVGPGQVAGRGGP